jgi:hypothetical protein
MHACNRAGWTLYFVGYFWLAEARSGWVHPLKPFLTPMLVVTRFFRPPFSCPPYQTGDHVDDGDNRTLSVRERVRSGIKPARVRHTEESLRHLVSDRRYHKSAQSAAKFLGAIDTAGRNPAYRRDAQELRKERTALLSSS